MKTSIIFAACAFACGVAVAQMPPTRVATDGMASADKSSMGMGSMDMNAMDVNSDGMISKKEWTDYHTMVWGKMKATNDMVSLADMKTTMRGVMSDATPMKPGNGNMAMGPMHMESMDTNGDGMISKKEWMSHHTKMWSQMKTKKGMMPRVDMESLSKTGPF